MEMARQVTDLHELAKSEVKEFDCFGRVPANEAFIARCPTLQKCRTPCNIWLSRGRAIHRKTAHARTKPWRAFRFYRSRIGNL